MREGLKIEKREKQNVRENGSDTLSSNKNKRREKGCTLYTARAVTASEREF